MIYLLIDTCSLRDLIDIYGYSKYLSELEDLVINKKINLVTHNAIITEWNKHKSRWITKKTQKLLGTNNATNELVPYKKFITPKHLDEEVKHLDQLLESAILLSTPEIINNEFAFRYKKRLAPFHIKLDSQNDWEIIGSFLLYCETNNIQEAYFLSANRTDFGDSDSSLPKIHPHIQERFKSLVIHYFDDFRPLFEAVQNKSGLSVELISFNLIANKKYSYISTIRNNVLDSLIFLFEDLYSEVQFIPLHILKRLYPFAIDENTPAYYSIFNMSYISEEMYDFFANISITKERDVLFLDESLLSAINDYKNKSRKVLSRLTHNLIFNLNSKNSRKTISVHYETDALCNCLSCSFKALKFDRVLNLLQESETHNYKDRLKLAYFNVQMGNYRSANEIYDNICASINENKKADRIWLTYFICKYNQRHLGNFLQHFFANEIIDYELVERLKLIDPLEEAVKLKTHTDYNFLSFIADGDFFSEAFQTITELTSKIKSNYQSQLIGGWSHNQYVWELIEEFAKLDSFVNNNFIVYDSYSNFKKLFEIVLEGIFASYAISDNESNRFEEFDNFWLSKVAIYGTAETIRKLASHYQIKSLKYKIERKEESISQLLQNLVGNPIELNTAKEKGIDAYNMQFPNLFTNIFDNLISIASILDISKGVITNIGTILFGYLKTNPSIGHSSNEAIIAFINTKGKLFSQALKRRFLMHFIKFHNWQNEELISSIISSFVNDTLSLTNKTIEFLLFQHFEICSVCNHNHRSSLFQILFEKLTENGKVFIKDQLERRIKIGADFQIYYLSSIYGITEFDSKRLFKEINKFKVQKNQESFRRMFSRVAFNEHPTLDQILNLAFKYNLDTHSKKFLKLSKVSLYYKWRLNMDDFNYINFNPLWVLHYKTIYYLKAMSKSENLKNALRQFLKKQNHKGIEWVLLKITNFIE